MPRYCQDRVAQRKQGREKGWARAASGAPQRKQQSGGERAAPRRKQQGGDKQAAQRASKGASAKKASNTKKSDKKNRQKNK